MKGRGRNAWKSDAGNGNGVSDKDEKSAELRSESKEANLSRFSIYTNKRVLLTR